MCHMHRPGGHTVARTPTELPSNRELATLLDSWLVENGVDPAHLRGDYPAVIENIRKYVLRTSLPSMAASDLVRNELIWGQWAKSVGLYVGIVDDSSDIADIERNVKYSLSLQTLETRIDELEPNMDHFISCIKTWVHSNRTIRWDAAAESPRLWEPLLNSWSLMKDSVDRGLNEATQRPLADQMLHLVFYQSVRSEDERYEILLEASLALPLPRVETAPTVASATADVIALKQVPISTHNAIFRAFTSAKISNRSLVSCLLLPPAIIKLGVFPVEAKHLDESAAKHQVGLDFCSIQRQRRALCLEDKRVYGAICVGGKFQLYVSYWSDHETLVVAFVPQCVWDLTDPVQFVRCLYFLRALKKHLDESTQDDFKNFNEQRFRESLQEGNEKSWRIEPWTKREPGREVSDGSSEKSRTGSVTQEAGLEVGVGECEADTGDGASTLDPDPITRQDFIRHLPHIADEVLKRAAIKDWQLRVASSGFEQTMAHEDEPEVTKESL